MLNVNNGERLNLTGSCLDSLLETKNAVPTKSDFCFFFRFIDVSVLFCIHS